METLLNDVKLGIRALVRQPLIATIILATLALGLGANAATFAMVDRLLLRPYAISDVDRLVIISEISPTSPSAQESVSPGHFAEWRAQASRVRHLTALVWWDVNLSGGDRPERVQGHLVSSDFFTVLGIAPALGRALQPSDNEWGRHHQVVISDSLWHRRFGGDQAVIGRSIRLDGESRTIVGVAPKGFDFPFGTDVWAPLALEPEAAANRRAHYLTVVALLETPDEIDRARAEMATIYARQKERDPDATRGRQLAVESFTSGMVDVGLPTMLALWQAAAAFLLLIGCTNVASLLLARATDRQNELAVRLALGASRGQIVRQLLTESAVLALAAVPLALGVGWMVLRIMRQSMPAALVRFVSGWNEMDIDGRVVLFTIAAAAVTCAVFGLLPAFSASRVSPIASLRDGGRTSSAGPARSRTRRGLVVAEVALALPLLVASGLAALAGHRLASGPQGYNPEGLFQMRMVLPATPYGDDETRRRFARDLLDRASAVPGVSLAGVTSVLPASVSNQTRQISIDGVPDSPDAPREVNFRAVSSSYLETMQISRRAGRYFTTADREDGQRVSIVSESFARAHFPGGSPIGRRIRIGTSGEAWTTVIGVASDTVDDWFFARYEPTIYVPFSQFPDERVSLVARTSGQPADLAAGLAAAMAAMDPAQPAYATMTMREALKQRTTALRFIAGFMAGVGGFALILAAFGVYGVMAHYVAQHRHDLGVRIALGATARDVLTLTVGQGARLGAIGIVIGLIAAVGLARLIESALFGIVALEIPLFLAVAGALATVALVATLLPALRASRLDAATVLRE